ncbi:solute carrier family 23 member 2-like isoform X4 [Portunus trituberculatus]|uniref:solute carrier family 23 member 2-like isoform X4 n=1 Tax=Portunus trituberculatus TaxID=210409 RepID=UPI001E1CFFA8|nr:solute carrier family 23 member 2-like isoform X4 [Portunus trituberculatus]
MVTETTKARAPCPEFSEAEVESAGKEVEMPKAASPSRINTNLIYSVEDVPPWYLTLLLGFQHYLTMASGTIAIPILAASFLCLEEDDPARGTLVSTVLVHSGIVTLLQTTFGVRTITLIIMFSFYLGNKAVPQSVLNTGGRACFFLVTAGTKMLKCFPVVLAVFLAWGLCAIFTAYDVLAPGSAARTDTKGDLLQRTPWFYVPYPGQWGWPRVTAAGVVSMLGASVASIMESIGDYHACARISGAPSPPISAINRGVFVEGLGCLLAGLLGTGSGTTSCSQNIGVISITKVASRRVVQISGVILIVSGLVGKFGAILVTIPEPVMAGVLVVMFAMITSIGLSSLQQVDLSSSRNLFILGFSIFFGLLLPKWLTRNPESLLGTGWAAFDQVLRVFLLTPMMVGGVVGCVLDNTISGTPEERGLKKEERVPEDSDEECYNLPWITPWIKSHTFRLSWMRFLPVCSTYLRKPNLSHQV